MEIKDKPASMSVREWTTRKIAQEVMIPEKIIRQVIVHSYDSALTALEEFNSIEISGFGKFFYNKKKAYKEKQRLFKKKDACEVLLNSEGTTEKERRKAERELKLIKHNIMCIYKKVGDNEQ